MGQADAAGLRRLLADGLHEEGTEGRFAGAAAEGRRGRQVFEHRLHQKGDELALERLGSLVDLASLLRRGERQLDEAEGEAEGAVAQEPGKGAPPERLFRGWLGIGGSAASSAGAVIALNPGG